MNPEKRHPNARPREQQGASCCEGRYQRWRFLDRDYPSGHTHCSRCGKELQWATKKKAQPRPPKPPVASAPEPILSGVERRWREFRATLRIRQVVSMEDLQTISRTIGDHC